MFESFVVFVLHLGFQRLVHTFLILTLLLLLTLHFFGIADVLSDASLQLAFLRTRTSALCLLDAALLPRTSSIVRILFFDSAVLPLRL